ncbi:unnamed protein product [Amoebophrya sp. A120]|nr:unnamed protein product [Amoebophrya sp. A120]|eukprot:GSA120T00010622001.1
MSSSPAKNHPLSNDVHADFELHPLAGTGPSSHVAYAAGVAKKKLAGFKNDVAALPAGLVFVSGVATLGTLMYGTMWYQYHKVAHLKNNLDNLHTASSSKTLKMTKKAATKKALTSPARSTSSSFLLEQAAVVQPPSHTTPGQEMMSPADSAGMSPMNSLTTEAGVQLAMQVLDQQLTQHEHELLETGEDLPPRQEFLRHAFALSFGHTVALMMEPANCPGLEEQLKLGGCNADAPEHPLSEAYGFQLRCLKEAWVVCLLPGTVHPEVVEAMLNSLDGGHAAEAYLDKIDANPDQAVATALGTVDAVLGGNAAQQALEQPGGDYVWNTCTPQTPDVLEANGAVLQQKFYSDVRALAELTGYESQAPVRDTLVHLMQLDGQQYQDHVEMLATKFNAGFLFFGALLDQQVTAYFEQNPAEQQALIQNVQAAGEMMSGVLLAMIADPEAKMKNPDEAQQMVQCRECMMQNLGAMAVSLGVLPKLALSEMFLLADEKISEAQEEAWMEDQETAAVAPSGPDGGR